MKAPALLLSFFCVTCAATSVTAKPIIEDRGLSNVKPLEVQPTREWQMYQRIKTLDQAITQLQDKIERLEAKLDKQNQATAERLEVVDKRLDGYESVLLGEQDEGEGDTADAITDNSDSNATETGSANDSKTTNTGKTSTNTDKPVDEAAAKKDYVAAYDAFKKSGAAAGVAGMNAFIKRHPKSKLVASAHYWAGEFYLSGKTPDLDAAQLRFSTVVKQYPKDSKAPRALYRIANLADADGKTSAAKKYMTQLRTQYPQSKEAKLATDYLNRPN